MSCQHSNFDRIHFQGQQTGIYWCRDCGAYKHNDFTAWHLPNQQEVIIVIPMHLYCPLCHKQHIDEGEFEIKPHHTHACQHCGHVWRPAVEPTRGVQFLPGFKNKVQS